MVAPTKAWPKIIKLKKKRVSYPARRAWFIISKLIYKDKRIPVARAFHLVDSLVTPVAPYGSEVLHPYNALQETTQESLPQVKILAFWCVFLTKI
jgi:hypothetical protein